MRMPVIAGHFDKPMSGNELIAYFNIAIPGDNAADDGFKIFLKNPPPAHAQQFLFVE